MGTYTSRLTCSPSAVLGAGGGGRSGTLEVPASPVPVTCTFINTRTSATMTLQKEWLNGATGDSAELTISGSDEATFGTATSTALGAPGSHTDTTNQASATIFSGATVDVAEALGPANTGSYTSQVVCDQPGMTPDEDAGKAAPSRFRAPLCR